MHGHLVSHCESSIEGHISRLVRILVRIVVHRETEVNSVFDRSKLQLHRRKVLVVQIQLRDEACYAVSCRVKICVSLYDSTVGHLEVVNLEFPGRHEVFQIH